MERTFLNCLVCIMLAFAFLVSQAQSFPWSRSSELPVFRTEGGADDHFSTGQREVFLKVPPFIDERASSYRRISSWSLAVASSVAIVFVILLCSLRNLPASRSDGINTRRLAVGSDSSVCGNVDDVENAAEGGEVPPFEQELYNHLHYAIEQASSIVGAVTLFPNGNSGAMLHVQDTMETVFTALQFSAAAQGFTRKHSEALVVESKKLVESIAVAVTVLSARTLEPDVETNREGMPNTRGLYALAEKLHSLCSQLHVLPTKANPAWEDGSAVTYLQSLQEVNLRFTKKVLPSLLESRNDLFFALWPIHTSCGLPLIRQDVPSSIHNEREKAVAPMMLHFLSASFKFANSDYSPDLKSKVVAAAFQHVGLQILVLKWKFQSVLKPKFLHALLELGTQGNSILQEMQSHSLGESASAAQEVWAGSVRAEYIPEEKPMTEGGTSMPRADLGVDNGGKPLDLQMSKLAFFNLVVHTTLSDLGSDETACGPSAGSEKHASGQSEGSSVDEDPLPGFSDGRWAIAGALFSSYAGAALLHRASPGFDGVERGRSRRFVSRFFEMMMLWEYSPLRLREFLDRECRYPRWRVDRPLQRKTSKTGQRQVDMFLNLADFLLSVGGSGEGTAVQRRTYQGATPYPRKPVWPAVVFNPSQFNRNIGHRSNWASDLGESTSAAAFPRQEGAASLGLSGDNAGNTPRMGGGSAAIGPSTRSSDSGDTGPVDMEHISSMLRYLLDEE